MSIFSKAIRKAERWVKGNKRLNRAVRKLRDMLIEDAIDEVKEVLDWATLKDLSDRIRRILEGGRHEP